MNAQEYKYDVAFSFLAEDEAIALQLNDLIKGRLETFLYSERQREIAGTDGENSFNQVFASDARTVVVLYRELWGQTKWTRIEETAIKNRAFDEGYDFVLFIPLDSKPSVPKWLPKTRLWIGLERWGMQGAASVIEARVQEFGGAIKEENALDKAAQIARQLEAEQKRNSFLDSDEGVIAANNEIEKLFSEVKNITEKMVEFNCRFERKPFQCVVVSKGIKIVYDWYNTYSNTLDESYLKVSLESTLGKLLDVRQKGPRILHQKRFQFDIDDFGRYGWKEKSCPETIRTSCQLADYCMKIFVESRIVFFTDFKRWVS